MAVKPITYDIIGSSMDIHNYVRAHGSQNLKDALPVATPDNSRQIGTILLANTAVRNEYLPAMYNRIALVQIQSERYDDPLSPFKSGKLEVGNTIEESFVDLIDVFKYDPAVDQNKFWKRSLADVRSAFHVINYFVYYPVTINRNILSRAFLSWGGVDDMIAGLVDAMYKSAAYDEFITVKYNIALRILDGYTTAKEVPAISKENMSDIATVIKEVSDEITFLNPDHNPIGVHTQTSKDDQYLFVTPKFNANMDVNVLASAFNMEKAEFMGHKILIDGFGKLDVARLKKIFTNSDGVTDEGYRELSQEDLTKLNSIVALLVDKKFFMWYDNVEEFTEFFNGRTIEWNYFYHLWELISTSPFAQCICFVPGKPTVDSVTVNPSEVTLSVGAEIDLTVNVTTSNFAPKAVNWTVDSDHATVDLSGHVKVLGTAQSAEQIVVTATAVYPNTDGEYESATCTITVA